MLTPGSRHYQIHERAWFRDCPGSPISVNKRLKSRIGRHLWSPASMRCTRRLWSSLFSPLLQFNRMKMGRIQNTMTIKPATVSDTQAIVSIFLANRGDPGLFQEPEAEVRRNLQDFLVARDAKGRAVACLGLHRDSAELAEIYGVAVLPELQGQGIGAMLMQKCKEQAAACQLTHLWLATVKPEYFRRHSFGPISRWSLPAAVLLRKFRQVFQQPVQRWVPAILGRHTFMKCNLLDTRSS